MSKVKMVRLIKGYDVLNYKEFKAFQQYDSIMGVNVVVEELDRWYIEDEDIARERLNLLRNTYHKGNKLWYVTEYALEYFIADEDGDFIEGSDFDFAEDSEEASWEEARRRVYE